MRIIIAVARKVIPRGLPMRRRVAYPAEHRENNKEIGQYGVGWGWKRRETYEADLQA